MAEVLARIVALGASAAERGGNYCALCFATQSEKRLVNPRHLQSLVELLVGSMSQLGPVASALTWGARACPWCEARCAAAMRALRALAAASGAHALLAQLDTGQDIGSLEQQSALVEEALSNARAGVLRCTDVLLIDTQQPVMGFNPVHEGIPPTPPTNEIETVIIEDDPPDPLAPSVDDEPATASPPPNTSVKKPVSSLSSVKPVPLNAGTWTATTKTSKADSASSATESNGAETSPRRVAVKHTARRTVPVSKPNILVNSANTKNTQSVNSAVQVQNSNNNVPNLALSGQNAIGVGPGASSPMLAAALGGVGQQATPQLGTQTGTAGAPGALGGDAVLMVLPPGAQIVSRLDGMGPKYLLLNHTAATTPACLTPLGPPPSPLATVAPAVLTVPGITAPPGTCTVSCDSDSDSNDSILLSELIQRRDEYNRKHKNRDTDTNNTKTNNITDSNSFSMGNNKCYITDVKSLSEEKSKSTVNSDKQCYITNVKSLSEKSVNNNNSKRNSEVTRPSKKVKSDSYEEKEARAPPLNTDRVDWEDKIPMDVISFVDATDPRAESFLPPKAIPKILNHTLDTNKTSTALLNNSKTISNNIMPVISNAHTVPSAQTTTASAQTSEPSAQSVETEGPRPLALISNVTSATGEKSVVIDLC